MTREGLLTVQEFADLIRVHPGSVYRRIRQGRQPGVHRFGRDVRIDLACALLPSSAPSLAPRSCGSALGRLFTRV